MFAWEEYNMTLFLLILIAIMVLVTMVCSIITTIIEVKDEKEGPLVKKVLGITAIVVLVVAVIGLAVGVSSIKDDDSSNNTIEEVALEDAGFNEVTLDEYLDLVNASEKSIILVARPTCSYCEAFTPILSEAADDLNLTVNYIDTDKFTEEDWSTFTASLDYLANEEWGTPLTMIVQNGNLIDTNNGYVELDTIKDFFTSNGLGE